MYPTYDIGDRLVAEKITYKYIRWGAPRSAGVGAAAHSIAFAPLLASGQTPLTQPSPLMLSTPQTPQPHPHPPTHPPHRPPVAGDVIIFHPGQGVGRKSFLGDDVFIKRVVAVEGDKVEVHDGTLFVNDTPRTEPFINEAPAYVMSPLVVPPGDVRLRFVAGWGALGVVGGGAGWAMLMVGCSPAA